MGLGLTDPRRTHAPAFLSSCFTYATHDETALSDAHFSGELAQALRDPLLPQTSLPEDLAPFQTGGGQNGLIARQWRRQKWWSSVVESHVIQQWNSAAPLRLRKLRELAAAKYSADATKIIQQDPELPSVSPRGWLLYTKFQLGLPLTGDNSVVKCPGCKHVMDSMGDHALCCSNLGVYLRHNLLRNEVASICTEAGLATQSNAPLAGSSRKPADLLIHGIDSTPLAVDFSVTHPLQHSAHLADVSPGIAAKGVEKRKIKESQALCHSHGWSHTPFVFETIGAWGGKGKHLLQQLIKTYALKQSLPLAEAAAKLRTRLATTLLSGLARQLERAFPSLEEGITEDHSPHIFQL